MTCSMDCISLEGFYEATAFILMIINPGSIGQPFNGWKNFKHDQRAHYAILEVNEIGNIDFDFRRIAYDAKKELRRAKEVNLPFFDLYQELLETGITHTHDVKLLETDIEKYWGIF